jgi:hypothetical protein
MRGLARRAGLFALAISILMFAAGATTASADTGDIIAPQNDPPSAEDGFQAGTCATDGVYPVQCSPDSPPAQWFTVAGGHPEIGFTQYMVKREAEAPFLPVGSPKTIRVDLPPGLTVNPQATEQCPLAVFQADETECPASSEIGREEVTVAVVLAGTVPVPGMPGVFFPVGTVLPPTPGGALNTLVPIYNLVPEFGEAARFGFKIGPSKAPVYLEGDVDWSGDYHQGFTIKLPPPNPAIKTVKSRLVNFGKSGDGTYISNPTTCFDPDSGAYTTRLRADSVAEPNPNFPVGQTPWEAGLPEGVEQENCDTVPFDPSLDVVSNTDLVDSPIAPTVTVELPFEPDENGQEQSHVRNASLTMPAGLGLNPSAANGLAACSDAQFGKGTRNPVTCPPASRIGTAEVETQPLEPGSLKGDVYLAQQQGFDPESGNMYRIFINPVSERYGIDVRLIGNIRANAQTGQLTAVLAENPQVPFETVALKLDPAKETLTSPPTCGPNTTNSAMEPWARPGTTENPSSSFALTGLPGGGPCPATLAERPFGPSYDAGPAGSKAGAFSPFAVRIDRTNGQQEIKRVDVKLPPGMVAKLRGVQYCPEENIAAAANRSGTSVIADPACPNSSWVGTSDIAVGTGEPFVVKGNAYLAGPYKGAPLSMAFITGGVAGPFDVGTVVVRVALNVDPETAEVEAVSDAIPDVFGGVKLDIRRIDVSISRKNFTLNPTTCRQAFPIASRIFGGGADPADPAAWSSTDTASSFRASECRKLAFKPRFFARIFGGKNQTRRTANPKFRAIFDARNGDANLRRAAFILPRATILDQSHIRTICTRVQLAARNCPKASIYGHARATSPLLKGRLKGPVYLTSSDNPLPDLLADLRGQVDVQLRGIISSKGARLKTVFPRTPDVAVDKFILTMKGGNRGLLVNSQNLCRQARFGVLNLRAQNSRRLKTKRLGLNIPACRAGRNN